MSLSLVDMILWAAGSAGQVLLLSILLVQGRWRTYPWFTILIGFEVAASGELYLATRFLSPVAYSWSYWVYIAIDFLMQMAVLLELTHAFFGLRQRALLFTLKPMGWLLLSITVAAVFTYAIRPPHTQGADRWASQETLFTSLLVSELFVTVSVLANRLNVYRRSHPAAILQGLALVAAVSVMDAVSSVAVGWRRGTVPLDILRMVVYLIVLIYWSSVLWKQDLASPEARRA